MPQIITQNDGNVLPHYHIVRDDRLITVVIPDYAKKAFFKGAREGGDC